MKEGASDRLTDRDRGFLLGDALFETILLRRGRPFRVGRHFERLREACRRTGIPWPDDLETRVATVLEAPDPAPWSALRITLTRGEGHGLAPQRGARPGLFISVRTIDRTPPQDREALDAGCFGRIEERSLSAGLKHTGYLERVLALRAARSAGWDEALLANSRGRLVEGAASNLFWVREGRVRSPGPAEGALPGVTRQAILELARAADLLGPPDPSAPTPAEAATADELFLSSSLRGPTAVVRLDGVEIGRDRHRGRPGPVFLHLATELESLIDRETTPGAMAPPSPPARPS